MQKQNDFNAIAPFYDWLCKLVFGKRVENAQIEALKFIPANSTILIVGGGTGWILDEISRKHPYGLTITYIDASSKMIQLSKNRNPARNTIAFIIDTIENVSLPYQHYDIIITPFFLDCFSATTVSHILKKLDHTLKINGLWLNIDFYLSSESKYWQKITLKIMYSFFRLLCHIEASKLPPVSAFFAQYSTLEEKIFCNKFIRMQIFKKHIQISPNVI